MKLNGNVFYYSGDANGISYTIVDKLKNGQICRIYQDTCGLDYEGNAHLSLRKLCDTIPCKLRNKVYCMHLDKNITVEDIKHNGFNVVDINK